MKTELDKAWVAVQRGHREWRTACGDSPIYNPIRNMYPEWLNYKAGRKRWQETVHRICGPDGTIQWTTTGCVVLGVMKFFYEN